MKCAKCGCELPDEAKFCSHCGARATTRPERPASSSYIPDIARLNLENGSANFWMYYDENMDTLYNINTDETVTTSDGIIMYDIEYNEEQNILAGYRVESFYASSENEFIIFRTADGNGRNAQFKLWRCDLEGDDVQYIAGDSKDEVKFYTITDNWIFAVLENKKGQQFIYQISADLKSAVVIKKGVHICWPIAADDEFLYYMTGYPMEVTLMQYDIRSRTEQVILKNKGISRFQLYRKHLIAATYETFGKFDGDNGEKLVLISPKHMKMRSLSVERIAAREINCYLDFIFYTEKDSGYIYALPITGGKPRLVYAREAVNLNIVRGLLNFIDYKQERRVYVPILDKLGESKGKIPGYTGYKIPVPPVSDTSGDGENPDYLAMKC